MTEGYVEVARNRVLNPSFERAVPGSQTFRTNLCTNAGYQNNANLGRNPGVSATASPNLSTTGGPFPNTGYFEQTWSVVTTDPYSVFMGPGQAANPVTPGLSYTDTIWVWSSIAQVMQANVVQRQSGGAVLTEAYGPLVTVPANQWTALTLENYKAVAGATGYEVRARVANTANGGIVPPVGSSLRVSATLHEAVPKALPFFYGGSPNEKGFVTSFTGTANASPSIMQCSLVEVRRNLFIDPLFTQLANGFYWSPNRCTLDNPVAGQVRVLVNAVGYFPRAATTVNRMPVTAGQPYTFSVRCVSSTGTPQIGVQFTDSGGAPVSGATYTAPIVAGNRASITITAPAGATNIAGWFGLVDNTAVGVEAVFEKPLMEQSPVAGEPFDGYSTLDADLVPAWSGAADISPSTLSGALVDWWQINPAVLAVLSYRNASSGLTSMRMIPVQAGGSGSALVRTNASPALFETGKTYTVLGTVTVTAAGTTAFSRGITARTTAASVLGSATAPDAPGTYPLRFTFVANDPSNHVRVDNREPLGGPEVFWDNIFVIEGDYSGSYFDGDTANAPGTELFTWLGEKHNSMSIREVIGATALSSLESAFYGRRGFTGSLQDRRRAFYGAGGEWLYWAARSGLAPSERYSLSDHKYAAMRAATGASNQLSLTDLMTLYYRQTV